MIDSCNVKSKRKKLIKRLKTRWAVKLIILLRNLKIKVRLSRMTKHTSVSVWSLRKMTLKIWQERIYKKDSIKLEDKVCLLNRQKHQWKVPTTGTELKTKTSVISFNLLVKQMIKLSAIKSNWCKRKNRD